MAESQGQGEFWTGLVVGAVVGSVVGTVVGLSLAPRLQAAGKKSKPALSDDSHPDDNDRLLEVRRSLEAKINELNAAIQDTRSQLLAPNQANQAGH
ncbi:MAG: hypothetical protein Q6J68_04610 [Thermostichales cyanobacterium SZTDM-1c_bins_54]